MRDENSAKSKQLSWPKTLVKKWFNLQDKPGDFHADDVIIHQLGIDEKWRNKFPDEKDEKCTIRKSTKTGSSNRRTSNRAGRNKIDLDSSQTTDVHNYKIFVATWNVGGKSPPSYLNLEDWLHTAPPADIYVLGFQEIVPLNAGNVLGTEEKGPARKWQALVRTSLNNLPNPTDQDFEQGSNQDGKDSYYLHRPSLQSMSRSMRMTSRSGISTTPRAANLDRRFSVCDRAIYGHRSSGDSSDDDDGDYQDGSRDSSYTHHYSSPVFIEDRDPRLSRYCLVASKQMVGIFLMVWIKSDLKEHVRNLKVSCVGRGLMRYLGNKGSISISMSLHKTSFCFVCSHLSSGEKDGDELRRNADVMEILRKTRFPQNQAEGDYESSPQTILDHDRVIWLGDLNYRIALAYRSAKALVEMRNWRTLLENDQLRVEQSHGRVFAGWNEGNIYFPPTYKYSNNSDRYAGENTRPKEKRRTPAWCDRILWHGEGLKQVSYVRGESRFSDHRPVYSVFYAEVESINCSRLRKCASYNSSFRIEVEELLPCSYGYGQLNLY
ncbi:hypothetical protein ABFS82_14G201200 [Erythranthe guttata]